jgi:deoxyribodipyrimidine photolyase-related protein
VPTLRIVFFDQLSEEMEHFKGATQSDYFFFFESKRYCTHVAHHQKKLVFWVASMRHFSANLIKRFPLSYYHDLDAHNAEESLVEVLVPVVKKYGIDKIVCSEPSEYDLLHEVKSLSSLLSLPVTILEDNRFLASKVFFSDWLAEQKKPIMENFYRRMRKVHHILLDEKGRPEGGRWNYDKNNRRVPDQNTNYPDLPSFPADFITKNSINLVRRHFPKHFGSIEPFKYAVTRKDALTSLAHFIDYRLPYFGDFQDAMVVDEPFLFHSHLSLYLNNGLLHAAECIDAAVCAYQSVKAPLNAVEGFVRQILGWREYIRGMYWSHMPDYRKKNFFSLTNPLPDFFWTGNTKMACVRSVVLETKTNAYAHHIQRLMVIGNLSILLGLNPNAVQAWFWVVYADAYEWVHLPNVYGMGIFADGGLLASKPYLSSGSYINKMSNYCKNCVYNVKKKVGPDACPFNFSYWSFLDARRSLLMDHPRMGLMFRILAGLDPDKVEKMKKQYQVFLKEVLDE